MSLVDNQNLLNKKTKRGDGFASIKKHAFVITPADGKTIFDVKRDDVCLDFVTNLSSKCVHPLGFKWINDTIVVFDFEKSARVRFDSFSGVDYTANRIKFSQLYENVQPYDLISDLIGEEQGSSKAVERNMTIEECLKKNLNKI